MANQAQLQFAVKAVNEASRTLKDVQADIDKVSDTAEKGKGKMGGFASSLGSIAPMAAGAGIALAGSAVIGQVTSFVGGAVTAAKDLGESLNAVNVVFGDSSEKILGWGRDNATAYGLSSREFNQLVTPLGAMLQNYGFSADESADQSINLAKRAADMASVFNVDVGEALSAIQAGLRGEADPLEKFGVGLNAAAIESKALAMTGKDVASSLTDQEKKAASMALIMEQTADVEGDFVNTSDSLANSQRIAAAETEEMQAKLGEKLLPVTLLITKAKLELTKMIVDQLVPALEVAVKWFEEELMPILKEIGEAILPILTDALEQLKQLWEGLAPILEEVVNWFKENELAMAALVVVLGLLLVALFPLPAAIIAVTAAGVLLLAYWDEFVNAIDSVIVKVGEIIHAVEEIPIIGEIFKSTLDFIAIYVQMQIEITKVIIETAIAYIVNTVQFWLAIFKGDWGRAWDEIKQTVELILGAILQIVGIVLTGLKDLIWNRIQLAVAVIRDAIPLAISAATELGAAIVNGVTNGLVGLAGAAAGIPRAVMGAVSGLASDMYNAGFRAIEEFARGIVNAIPRILKGAIDKAIDVANPKNWGVPGLSPFFEAYEHAGQIAMSQLAKGMESGLPPGPLMAPVPALGLPPGGGFGAGGGGAVQITINAPNAFLVDADGLRRAAQQLVPVIQREYRTSGGVGLI